METIQSAPVEQDASPCIFNETSKLIDGSIEVDESTFNGLHRSLQGISAISRILSANGIAEASSGMEPLNGFLVSGLTDAVQMLSEFSIDAIERLANRRNSATSGD